MGMNAIGCSSVEGGLPERNKNEYLANELDLFCTLVIFGHFYNIDLHKNCLISLDTR